MKSLILTALLLASSAMAIRTRDTAASSSSTSGEYQRSVTGGMIEGTADPYYPNVGVWKGIPYAAPPTGVNRFQPTQPVQNWTGVKSTKQFSAGCLQKCVLPQPQQTCPQTYSEDCLFLNVFTPVPTGPNATAGNLPVFFFIHGGAFISGAGGVPLYESAKMAQKQNIVVVTINYRLGVFGALYMGEVAKGNYMLQDQRMALQWVQENIAQFGGDKNQVTLGGQSAGAMSTGSHLVSPLSKGLFRAAIMSSNPYGLPFQHPTLAASLASDFLNNASIGCQFGTQAGLACLQALPAETIEVVGHHTRNKATAKHALMALVPWVPIALTDELPQQPLVAVSSGNFQRVPVLLGNNANDSVLFINQISDKPISNFEVDIALGYIFGVVDAVEIKHLYGPPQDKKDTRIYFSRIGTDYMFYCPIRKAARAFSQFLANSTESGQPVSNTNKFVYEYQFNHLASFSKWMWEGNTPLCENYICHGDDLPFVFGSFYASPEMPNITTEEQQLSDYMQDSYGSFIRTGGSLDELNAKESAQSPPGPNWPVFEKKSDEFMAWMTPQSGPVAQFHDQYCAYWDKIGFNRE